MSEQDPVADYDKRMIAEFQATEGESAKPDTRDPWERLDRETPKAHAAFVEYLKLGYSRSLAKLSQRLGRTKQNFEKWSVKYDWVRRAAAYDADQDRIYRDELKQARRDMAHRHAMQAKTLQDFALKSLRAKFGDNLEKILEEGCEDLPAVSEILRYIVEGTKLERVALGEPSDIVEGQITGGNADGDRKPVVPLTYEGRIEQLAQIFETARARASSTATEQQD